MNRRWLIALPVLCFALFVGRSQEPPADPGLSVHEWGTFTSIAGAKGEAVTWMSQLEKDDLPDFVEHLQNSRFKGGLSGTVRMETPVLYFHALHPATVSVHVNFEQGLLTEWYPHASHPLTPKQLANPIVELKSANGGLTWNLIRVNPSDEEKYPRETAESRYYAARETSASPLTVFSPSGEQHEKFLFYRGVSNFAVPVSAIPQNAGRIYVSNLAENPISHAVLFERRGNRFGYRVVGSIQNSVIVEPPELNSDANSIARDLERILVAQCLNQDEAHAMLETWNDSWFEEGTRLLYIVPRNFVDRILPLSITPAPASVTRVFVGRMEIVTPTTESAVETAFAKDDRTTLNKYRRFLLPILQTMIARSQDKTRKGRLNSYLNIAYSERFASMRSEPQNLTQSSAAPTIISSQ